MPNYKEIFNKNIGEFALGKIFVYDSEIKTWEYTPFSHTCTPDGVKNLVSLLKRHLVFYCYSEEEIVNKDHKKQLNDLYKLAQRAYKERIPKRAKVNDEDFDAIRDGLQSELLLDLLIQLYVPNSYKFGLRAAYRQRGDNQELKGYDSLHFTIDENDHMELWLGQAKLGQYDYCNKGINDDLSEKYDRLYMADDLFFVIDKIADRSEYKIIWDFLDEANASNCCNNLEIRAEKLINTFRKFNITICIPCLLAYPKSSIYSNDLLLQEKLYNEVDFIESIFETKTVKNHGVNTKILFYIFPLESIDLIRSNKKGGLYEGLPVRTC